VIMLGFREEKEHHRCFILLGFKCNNLEFTKTKGGFIVIL